MNFFSNLMCIYTYKRDVPWGSFFQLIGAYALVIGIALLLTLDGHGSELEVSKAIERQFQNPDLVAVSAVRG